MNKKTVLITGGSGMVGSRLTQILLAKNYAVRILSREKKNIKDVEVFLWDVEHKYIDVNALNNVDYVVHLAGANIAEKKWTKKRKEELYVSRIDSGKLLIQAINANAKHPEAIVAASATGIYLPSSNTILETGTQANDFAAVLCQKWEEQNLLFQTQNIRTNILRFGLVLSSKGGFLKELLKPLLFFIAPVFGNGKQIISWIHIDDLCNMIIFCIENKSVSGVYNAVAPEKISNYNLVRSLQSANGKLSFKVQIPAFFLKFILGERAFAILNSYAVVPDKIIKQGFEFIYKSCLQAIKDCIRRKV